MKIFFRKKLILLNFFVNSLFLLNAETQGERLFRENKPLEAAPILEKEIEENIASKSAYNFLGLCYYQTNDYENSIRVFEQGLSVSGTDKKILSFNLANTYYAAKDFNQAVKYYSLSYSADSQFSGALLNRANSYLNLSDYENALSDYKNYVNSFPEKQNIPTVKKMISALEKKIQDEKIEAQLKAEEEARIAEEEKRFAEEAEKRRIEEERIAAEKKAEEERLLEEKRKAEEEARAKEEARLAEERKKEEERLAAEAERRRKILEEVANSLQQTDSTNMSSGTEDILEYEEESELD